MKIRLMKLFDSVLGRIVASVFSKPRIIPAPVVTSILIIRPGGIGDAVLLATAVRTFKNNFLNAYVTILAERRNAGVFLLIPGITRVLCYDRPNELLQAVRGEFDIVLDTEQWHRLSAVVARLASAPVKIGFATNERLRMFTHTIPYFHDDYETVSFARLLEPLECRVGEEDFLTPFLFISDAASATAFSLLDSFQEQPFVIVFPGASIQERQWGADRFRQVAEVLTAFGIKIVVVGGKEDRKLGEVITGGVLGLNLAGMTSLPETAAVIQRSALLLSGDSGVLHIAVGLGVPTVSLFGPGRAKKWAPRGDHHIVINKKLPCSPCTTFGTTPPCPYNVRCMQDITVDEVVNAVTMLLTSVGSMLSKCCKRAWIETE